MAIDYFKVSATRLREMPVLREYRYKGMTEKRQGPTPGIQRGVCLIIVSDRVDSSLFSLETFKYLPYL